LGGLGSLDTLQQPGFSLQILVVIATSVYSLSEIKQKLSNDLICAMTRFFAANSCGNHADSHNILFCQQSNSVCYAHHEISNAIHNDTTGWVLKVKDSNQPVASKANIITNTS
jgi:hypothetical protein